jgi:hypothetical protein
MAILRRIRNICVDPVREWSLIEREHTPREQLFTRYLVPLAAMGAVAAYIGVTIVARVLPFVAGARRTAAAGLIGACLEFLLTLSSAAVLAWTVNGVAPGFGGRRDRERAFAVAVYALTPGLVAGLLAVLPVLNEVVSVVAGLYGVYLLYLALPLVMQVPPRRAVACTAVVVLCVILVTVAVGLIVALIGGTLRIVAG